MILKFNWWQFFFRHIFAHFFFIDCACDEALKCRLDIKFLVYYYSFCLLSLSGCFFAAHSHFAVFGFMCDRSINRLIGRLHCGMRLLLTSSHSQIFIIHSSIKWPVSIELRHIERNRNVASNSRYVHFTYVRMHTVCVQNDNWIGIKCRQQLNCNSFISFMCSKHVDSRLPTVLVVVKDRP